MDKNIELTPEELSAEQAGLAESKEDEVRASIVSEFGFDEADDFEKIDKLVAKEMKSRKDLSHAIGQKIKLREELKKILPTPPQKEEKKFDSDEVNKLVDSKLRETLEQRDLESLGYPEELQAEIRKVAKAQGVTIKQAVADPYIQFKIESHEKANKAEEATISRTNKSSGKSKAPSLDNPPETDMSTEAGRKKWDDYLAFLKKQETS